MIDFPTENENVLKLIKGTGIDMLVKVQSELSGATSNHKVELRYAGLSKLWFRQYVQALQTEQRCIEAASSTIVQLTRFMLHDQVADETSGHMM